MTLEQLLNSSADELDKLTTEELTSYFKQFFPVTRPELARKAISDKSGYSTAQKKQMDLPKLDTKQQEHLAKLAALGIDISFATHPVRKRR